MHCKRRGSEKSTFLAIFWGLLTFSGSPILWEFHKKTFKFNINPRFLQTPLANPLVFTMHLVCTLSIKNRTWYQTRKHVCAKARLRNPGVTNPFRDIDKDPIFQPHFTQVFFLPPLFCQRIPAFWTQNLGKNRLISAKNRLKFDQNSTKNRRNLSWNRLNGGSSFQQLRWWERTPNTLLRKGKGT